VARGRGGGKALHWPEEVAIACDRLGEEGTGFPKGKGGNARLRNKRPLGERKGERGRKLPSGKRNLSGGRLERKGEGAEEFLGRPAASSFQFWGDFFGEKGEEKTTTE